MTAIGEAWALHRRTSTLSAIEGLHRLRSGTVLVDGINVRKDPRGARQWLG
jgi:ABC-type branched-subunit amino acid transport system ATPase component